MRFISGITLALALISGSAHAATGRTTDRTYTTMNEAAKATGAFLASRARLAWRANKMTVSLRGSTVAGKVRTLNAYGPKTPFGYPAGYIQVKVVKVKGGWKGYTDTPAKVIFLK
jgi:hypothetical protein